MGTLSVVVVRLIREALAHANVARTKKPVDPDAFLAGIGITPADLASTDARLPAELVFRAFERSVEATGDELMFLRCAELLPLGALGALDFAVRGSSTMVEGLARVVRYYAFIDDESTLETILDGDVVRLRSRRRRLASPRAATELLYALVLSRGRELTGQPCPVRAVSFLHPGPADPRGHATFFGREPSFGQAYNELVLDAAWLSIPVRTADPPLAAFLDRQIDALVPNTTGTAEAFLDQARRAIAESIRGTDPLLSATAKRLAISERTLQRRLREEGSSHRDLVEEVRRKLALDLLADDETPVAEIGYLLGFSSPSAFHHAFARWTGSTPAAHRSARRRPA